MANHWIRRTGEAHRSRAQTARAFAVTLLVGLACVGLADRSAADSRPRWTAPLVPLVVVHGFDLPTGPYAPGHRGVDLLGVGGQPVLAAADGVVTYAGEVGGIGVVTISHGAIATTYQPLWGHVVAGAAVSGGEPIGHLAPVGGHCAPEACLHWGAVLDQHYVDPLALLDPGPSRLLPYWASSGEARRPAAPVQAESWMADATTREPIVIVAPAYQIADVPTSAPLTGSEGEPLSVVADPGGSLPPAAAAAIAIFGGVLAGAAFVVIRRRRR